MHRSVFFDLDGTLTDSGEGIFNSVEQTLGHFGLHVPSREELRVFVGPPLRKSFADHGIQPQDIEEAMAIYRSRYDTVGLFENTPYPGIREMLADLKSRGFRLFVATSKPEHMALRILERFELAPYFERICGATMDASRVNKDMVIACLLEQIGTDSQAVMVGDTAYDVLGARAHGIPTIGVSWGYGKVEDMEIAGAAAIAHSVEDLHNMLIA